jgi:DNA-binding response OmpR family regulator
MHLDPVLRNKRILVVDDEPDIVESLAELLEGCVVDQALSFKTADKMLSENPYDAAILDIMGVDGHLLLQTARSRGIPALMLTAHALNLENLSKALKGGAYAYVPKDRITDIGVYLAEVVRAAQNRTRPSGKWFTDCKPVFDRKFGRNWQQKDLTDELKRMFVFSRQELEKIL